MGTVVGRNYLGGADATMSGSGSGGGSSNPWGLNLDVGALQKEMLKSAELKRQMLEEELRQYRLAHAPKGVTPTLSGRDAQSDARQNLADQVMVANTKAITGPAPLKRVNPMGSTGAFDTIDDTAMSGAQRGIFLPGGSTMPVDSRDAYRAMLDAGDQEQYTPAARRRNASGGSSLSY